MNRGGSVTAFYFVASPDMAEINARGSFRGCFRKRFGWMTSLL
jgi:hypothetical protein